MFPLRLVRLIEDHADQLSEGLLKRLRDSGACNDLLTLVPPAEVKSRTYEIYRNVTEWVLTKAKSDVEERYLGLGARRAHQEVPFSQMLYALQTVKEYLWEFLRQEGLLEPQELISEMELLDSMERFFDRISYFAALGYESARVRDFAHTFTKREGYR